MGTNSQEHVDSICTKHRKLGTRFLNFLTPFPFAFTEFQVLVFILTIMLSPTPGMHHRIPLVCLVIVSNQDNIGSIDVIPMGKESNPTATLFAVKHIVQIRVNRNHKFSMTPMKTQSSSPHGIGQLGADKVFTFFSSPIADTPSKGHHAQIGDGSFILVVGFNVCNIGTQDGIIILGPVMHFNQTGIKALAEIHVTVNLHAVILFIDSLQINFISLVTVDVIPMNHGR
mmetsp:Transcript_1007/g.1954  ORF Transcript_1007/g.1954 Transcript_1007/m.1954 type:complete len:228 (+) Transcript_1007:912-1595(+)